MTIEVRQLLVRAQVGASPAQADAGHPSRATTPPPAWVQRLRRELLAECKAWLREQQQREHER
jgi:hypothetical protein